MTRLIFALSVALYSPTLFADSYSCRNAPGDILELEIIRSGFVPAVRLRSEKLELRGFAKELRFADGTVRLSVDASVNHHTIITIDRDRVSLYWSLALSPEYRCDAVETDELADDLAEEK